MLLADKLYQEYYDVGENLSTNLFQNKKTEQMFDFLKAETLKKLRMLIRKSRRPQLYTLVLAYKFLPNMKDKCLIMAFVNWGVTIDADAARMEKFVIPNAMEACSNK